MTNLYRYCGDLPNDTWVTRVERLNAIIDELKGVTPAKSKRQLVVDIARSQLGKSDPGVYWSAVLPKTARPPYPKHWCGAGYLWCLHQAGLATEVQWRIGLGLSGAMQRAGLSFPTTKSPQPGDMAYFTRNQPRAVVVEVSGGLVRVVNFNGAGGRVTETVHPMPNVAAFFSIEKLIAPSGR